MPKRRREFNPNSFYHCILRGNNRRYIFETPRDMRELMRAFDYTYDLVPFRMLAFCFMTNHYHVLIRAEAGDISKIMRLVNRRYSDVYRHSRGHVGRIYQRRYWAKEVPSILDLLHTSGYIHRNPIETSVPMVTQLEDYPYSSFPYYAETRNDPPRFLDVDLLPKMMPFPYPHTRLGYCQFVLQNRFLADEDPHEVVDEKMDLLYEKGGFLWRGRVMQGAAEGERDDLE
ncbi:transposase [Chryseomicrobium palamuruense]|uniref:Transposase n=1 Tax=Chryseomicrobium palamuruense TaxID=682973 RepID=A0ABV8UTT0_9BACL